MSDSQIVDYLEITQSLLENRKEWEDVPQIISLTFKAISHLLTSNSESFVQHKTLINEQSLKVKQLQLRLGAKVSKKDLENEVANCIKAQSFIEKREADQISQYEKLIKQSRYEKQRNDNLAAEEIKTISQLVAQRKILQFQKGFQGKALAQRLQLQQKVSGLRQEFRIKIQQYERDLKEVKDRIHEYKHIQSRFEQSHHRSVSSNNEEKINFLQNSNRRMNDSLNHIISHIQSNYFTKDELIKIIESLKNQKDKSPIRKMSREEGKAKHTRENIRDDETEINRIVQQSIQKTQQKQAKQLLQFKQLVMRQMGKMVKIQVVNNLIDSFQKQVLERYQDISAVVTKLQSKINKSKENFQKQLYVKSQKRPQKKSSPHKSIQSIHNSLSRLQKSITQRQATQMKRVLTQVQDKIKRYDSKLVTQLDRRQKHLCEVIEQTYNQCINTKNNGKTNNSDLNSAYQILFQSNIYCRYLYIGTKQCKKQSYIVWQKQALNCLVQNFIWKGQVILINSPGLYRLQFAMFGDIDTQTHLILNGQLISLIPKPQFINNASKKVVGNFYHQLLLLPSKSKLSFKANQQFYGQAFLSLQKL